MKIFLISAMLVFVIVIHVSAETSGANFLLEDSNTKSFSMGSAFTAYSDNSDSLNINPAGIGFIGTPSLSAGYKKNLVDGFNSSVFITVPMKTSGVFGIGLTLYDLGNIEINNIDGTSETINAMRSWTANLGYSINIVDEFAVGLNLKYISSSLAAEYTGTAFAADFGLMYRTIDSTFSCGLAFQNIGTKLTYISDGDSLPFTVRTGISVKLRDSTIDTWLATADLVYYDSKLRYNAGVECNLFKILSIRAGYKMGYAPDTLSFGAGFNISQVYIDYAYSMLGSMDNVNMFSVSYKFDLLNDFDLAKVYLEKGMTERALFHLKAVKRFDSNYKNALKYIDDIGKEKEYIKQANINKRKQEQEQDKVFEEKVRQEKMLEAKKWSGTKIKIAVINLEAKAVSIETAGLISDLLRNDLFELGKYNVVERAEIDKILKEQAFQQTGCTAIRCAVEIGKILNVQQSVIGTVGRLGEKFIINVRLLDVETAELIITASEQCDKEADLIDICKSIARKLCQK